MKSESVNPASRLYGLALRLGLAVVLFGWGYDFHFNGQYYERLFGPSVPTAALGYLQIGLASLLTIGLGTRVVAPAALILFAAFGLAQNGHQPIGLAQNIGLAAAAAALYVVGPGALAVVRPRPVSEEQLRRATLAVRIGMAATFLVYGADKFFSPEEYRIVVTEAPLLAPVIGLVGASNTVLLAGVVEIATALVLLAPSLATLAAFAQIAILAGLLVSYGYPFSYPQDLGLLGALGAVVLRPTLAWLASRPVRRPVDSRQTESARLRRPVPAN